MLLAISNELMAIEAKMVALQDFIEQRPPLSSRDTVNDMIKDAGSLCNAHRMGIRQSHILMTMQADLIKREASKNDR